jgi:uncharacterized protein (DUF1330 family)
MNVSLSKSELLQLISAAYVEGKDEELKRYFEQTLPLAMGHGFAPLVRFDVAEVLSGTFRPEGFIGLYKWPSAAAAEGFRRDPLWPPIEATRPLVFRELRVHTTVVDDDLTVDLNGDHAYEIQFLWLSRDNADAYREYADVMPAMLAELGGRIVASLAVGSYENLQPWPHQPDEIVILEWPDTAARTAYLSSDGFLRNQTLLHCGVANAESFLTRPRRFE